MAFGLLQRNPASRLKPPKDVPHEITPPTIEEALRFLRAAEGDCLYGLWAFLALTGARKGEALALRWTDIDWTAHTVTIQRTMTGEAGSRTVAAPKTRAGRRVVALSDHLLGILRHQQNAQRLEHIAAGVVWQNSGYVFTTAVGTWLSPRNVHRSFKQLVARAGLSPTTRIHDLRHAMATFWLANGVQPKVVSERLGHANVNITLQVYGHVLPNMQAEAANALDGAFFGDPAETPRRHHERVETAILRRQGRHP